MDAQIERTQEPLLLTVAQVIKKTGLSQTFVYSLIHSGELGSVRIGRKRLYVPKVALEKLLSGERSVKAGV